MTTSCLLIIFYILDVSCTSPEGVRVKLSLNAVIQPNIIMVKSLGFIDGEVFDHLWPALRMQWTSRPFHLMVLTS